MFRRLAAAVLLAFASCAATANPAIAQERVVNVYNWTDYVDPKVLEDFTRDTGIKVVYDMYDNNEIVETKLLAGRSGYDVSRSWTARS
jgi:putrescine transport system substrate-binding protein